MNRTPDSGETTPTDHDCVRGYVYEQCGPTHRWTHADTGLTVEVQRASGQRDPFGEILPAYRVVAHESTTGDVVEYICGPGFAGSLPGKSEAMRAARGWMASRPDGTSPGTE